MGTTPVSRAIAVYVWLFRGTPPLIVLFFCYFGLPLLGVQISPFLTALMGLTLIHSAYLGEVIRAGFQSVPPGQYEASRSLGLSSSRMVFRIVLPQAARSVIPPYITRGTDIIKDTALASIVAVPEATRAAYLFMASTFRPFEAFALVAVVFMAINGALLAVQPFAEKKLAYKR